LWILALRAFREGVFFPFGKMERNAEFGAYQAMPLYQFGFKEGSTLFYVLTAFLQKDAV
jgi:hypothetical protein